MSENFEKRAEHFENFAIFVEKNRERLLFYFLVVVVVPKCNKLSEINAEIVHT